MLPQSRFAFRLLRQNAKRNPVLALARIQAGVTQKELAKLMGVTQAYVSKIENQDKITPKMLNKVTLALSKKSIL